MKKTKKILTLLLMISLIIGSITFVQASALTISKIQKQGNIVTFTITVPNGGGLLGDVNNDGKVDTVDISQMIEFMLGSITENDINKMLTDVDCDGILTVADQTKFTRDRDQFMEEPIMLKGTLAEESTYEMSKISDGTFKVQITIPEHKEGTIGITIKAGKFKYDTTTVNPEISSNLLTISYNNNENGDGNDKEPSGDQTQTPSNGEDKEPSEDQTQTPSNGEDKGTSGDKTQATTKLPNAGVKNIIAVLIVTIAIVAMIAFIKSRKVLK